MLRTRIASAGYSYLGCTKSWQNLKMYHRVLLQRNNLLMNAFTMKTSTMNFCICLRRTIAKQYIFLFESLLLRCDGLFERGLFMLGRNPRIVHLTLPADERVGCTLKLVVLCLYVPYFTVCIDVITSKLKLARLPTRWRIRCHHY